MKIISDQELFDFLDILDLVQIGKEFITVENITFIDCVFLNLKKYMFCNCTFINCEFSQKFTEISFDNCLFYLGEFYNVDNIEVFFQTCVFYYYYTKNITEFKKCFKNPVEFIGNILFKNIEIYV